MPCVAGTPASSSRAVMSARSRDRPRTRKRQASSWLMVESARPKKSAARSRMNRRKTWGPRRSGARGGQAVAGDVEALPDLAGDDLADAAGAGPRGQDRAGDGAGALGIISQAEQGHPDGGPGGGAGIDAHQG